ncbi:MAG: lipoyl(octanoyl) transferase LipB [Syntrophomonadaceae bacterium]
MNRQGYCLELGTVEYSQAFELQKKLSDARRQGSIGDTVIFIEHPPCFTVGRHGGFNHILASPEFLEAQGIKVYETDRGGDITYHGPGQIVCYPILDLNGFDRDVHQYARLMEETLIRTLGAFGIKAGRHPDHPGVWVGTAKIAAEGIAIQQWVTMHGVALNVCPNMMHFTFIIPCGISTLGVTSMAQLLGHDVDIKLVQKEMRKQFCEVFAIELQSVTLDQVMQLVEGAKNEPARLVNC